MPPAPSSSSSVRHRKALPSPYPQSGGSSARPPSAASSVDGTLKPTRAKDRLKSKEKKKSKRNSLSSGLPPTPADAHPDVPGPSSRMSLKVPPSGSSRARSTSASSSSQKEGGRKKFGKSKGSTPSSSLTASLPAPLIPPPKAAFQTDPEPAMREHQSNSVPSIVAAPAAVETKEDILARYLPVKSHAPTSTKRPIALQPNAVKRERNDSHPSPMATAKALMVKDEMIKALRAEVVALKKKDEEARLVKEDEEKEKAALKADVDAVRAELAEERDKQAKVLAAKEEVLQSSMRTLDTLRDAVACGVCLETLTDPHILSCGHVACKGCLVQWFRTPAAYMHEVPDAFDTIPPTRDVSYRTKVCHVCRVAIFRRPARMYHIDSILSPLGINPNLPSASQEERESTDPWMHLFPPERDSYRIRDDADMVDRCPECNGEIEDDMCPGCGIEFSEQEDEGDWEDGRVLAELEGSEGSEGEEDRYDEEAARELIGLPPRVHGGEQGDVRAGVEADFAETQRARQADLQRRINQLQREVDELDQEELESVDGDLPGFIVPDGVDTDDEADDEYNEGEARNRARADARVDGRIRREERRQERRINRQHNLLFDIEASDDGNDDASGGNSDSDGSDGGLGNLRPTGVVGITPRERVRMRLDGELDDLVQYDLRRLREGAGEDLEEESDADLRLDEEEEYEDSFIDDDEEDEEGETGSGINGSEDDEDEDEDESMGERGEVDSEVGSVSEEELDAAQIRARRVARFDRPPTMASRDRETRSTSSESTQITNGLSRSGSAVANRRRRQIVDPDSD